MAVSTGPCEPAEPPAATPAGRLTLLGHLNRDVITRLKGLSRFAQDLGASWPVTFRRPPALIDMAQPNVVKRNWLGRLQGSALLPLRLVIGYGFAAHGYAKLSRGPAAFADILVAIGVPSPLPAAWVTSLLETAGGIAIMLGVAVVPLTLPLMAVMATAMFRVHARYGFSSVRLKGVSPVGAVFGPVGYEINLLYIAALLALAVAGSSPFSVDRWLEDRRRARQARPGVG